MLKTFQHMHTTCKQCCQVLRTLQTSQQHLSTVTQVTADIEKQQYHRKRVKHFYSELYVPWNNHSELTKHLRSNIIFENENYIAFNKPPGVPMQADSKNPAVLSLKSQHDAPLPEFATLSLEISALEISKQLNMKKNLLLGLPNSRLNSGVVVYAKGVEAQKLLKAWWRNTRANKVFALKYWALTVGIPQPERLNSGNDMFYVRRNKDQQSLLKYESMTFASRELRKNSKAVQSNIKHRILAANRNLGVALVEVQPTWSVNDMLQLYLTHRLSPILGDHIYSHLVTSISGIPTFLKPNLTEDKAQKLPVELRRPLDLVDNHKIHVPLHLHLAQAVVPSIGRKDKVYHTINAPLPQLFKESLHRLGIQYNNEPDPIDRDSLKPHNLGAISNKQQSYL